MDEDEVVEFPKVYIFLRQWHCVFRDLPRLVYATAVGIIDAFTISPIVRFGKCEPIPAMDFALDSQFSVGDFVVICGQHSKVVPTQLSDTQSVIDV